MANISPSTIHRANWGSLEALICDMNTASNGDLWNSSICNIVAILGTSRATCANGSGSGFATTYTAANGIINFQCNSAGARGTMVVLTGGGWTG